LFIHYSPNATFAIIVLEVHKSLWENMLMAWTYVIPDIEIENQELSLEDIKMLLRKEVISPFSLVKRSSEIVAMPLISHPDFEDEPESTVATPPSKNVVAFLERLEEIKNGAGPTDFTSLSKKTEGGANRRKEEVTVILTQGARTFTGTLVDRSGQERMRVITREMGLKIGQSVEILVVSRILRERLNGMAKVLTERADRREKGAFYCLYEIVLIY